MSKRELNLLALPPPTALPKPEDDGREPLRIEQVFDVRFNAHQLKHYWGVRTFVGFPKGVLTPHQVDAAREWLASSTERGQGRTTLLALCFLEKTIETPDKMIYYFDHNQNRHGGNMGEVLREMVDRHYIFRTRIVWHEKDPALMFQSVTTSSN